MGTATRLEKGDLEKLGTVVRKCFGTESPEQRNSSDGEFAEIVSVISEPTYALVDDVGRQFTWIQSITRPATEAEAIEYWKRRAKVAEDKLKAKQGNLL